MPEQPSKAPASPCTGVCQIDAETGLCAGCLRSLAEIAAWGAASADEQRRILEAVRVRRERIGRDMGRR